jgi:hypothetical protein
VRPTSVPYATDSLNGRKCPLTAANVFPFKRLPILPLLPISNGSWIYVIIPCITGASKPNERPYQNDWLHNVRFVISPWVGSSLHASDIHKCESNTQEIRYQSLFRPNYPNEVQMKCSSVCTVTHYFREIVGRIPVEAWNFSVPQNVRTGSDNRPSTYSKDTGGKTAVPWSWTLT